MQNIVIQACKQQQALGIAHFQAPGEMNGFESEDP
jgi:hypothetical protein